jgi:hypothetical protein
MPHVISVASPCNASWAQMTGDDRRRFCRHCGKFVHNLSAMPSDQAEALICSAAGSLCVRFARDQRTGQPITLDYRPPPRVSRGRRIAVVTSILASICMAATWVVYKVFYKPPTPTQIPMVMGEIAPVRPPPTPGGQ